MRTNVRTKPTVFTHEGAPAKVINPEQQLRRSVLSCLLFEKEFYEDGQEIAKRIFDTALQCPPSFVGGLAIQARGSYNLRHAPLLLLLALARIGSGTSLVSRTVEQVVQRADELAELVALYWKDGKRPLPAQFKKGLAAAFRKFDAYQIAKYDRANAVRLRDVLFLTHAKPSGEDMAALWKGLVDQTLESPDTWEVSLSGGAGKKETFERLLRDGKLGYLALLRNLRNMVEAEVDEGLIREAILARKGAYRVLPFRYVAAARAVPQLEPVIDQALVAAVGDMEPLPGMTAVLVDVSGSMDDRLSSKSDLRRIDAAAALASIIPGQRRVFAFSNEITEVAPRTGMAGVDAIKGALPHGGTYLGAAVHMLNQKVKADRLIVITDEQSHDRIPDPVFGKSYMINVASAQNGVGYHRWTHIDGFSESVLRFIAESERG